MSTFANASRLHRYHPKAIVKPQNRSKDGLSEYFTTPPRGFSRETERWWLLDASGMQVREAAAVAAHYVTGQTRADFDPRLFTPDQVVMINVKETVMVADNWSREPIKWESPWSGGKVRVRASELFERDPCMLMYHAVHTELLKWVGSKSWAPRGKVVRDAFEECVWLYEDALHPHADENPRPIRWAGAKKGITYKFMGDKRWGPNKFME